MPKDIRNFSTIFELFELFDKNDGNATCKELVVYSYLTKVEYRFSKNKYKEETWINKSINSILESKMIGFLSSIPNMKSWDEVMLKLVLSGKDPKLELCKLCINLINILKYTRIEYSYLDHKKYNYGSEQQLDSLRDYNSKITSLCDFAIADISNILEALIEGDDMLKSEIELDLTGDGVA
jgi:hypothetical protein